MSGQDLLGRYGSALMNTFGTPPRVLDRGEGAWVWDVDGHRYLDLGVASPSTRWGTATRAWAQPSASRPGR